MQAAPSVNNVLAESVILDVFKLCVTSYITTFFCECHLISDMLILFVYLVTTLY